MDKWTALFLTAFVIMLFTPLGVIEYGKKECRIEAIKAGVEADKIKLACGIK